MEQKIAAFLLGRGDYAYMGYAWEGCADALNSPYNNSQGAHFWAPCDDGPPIPMLHAFFDDPQLPLTARIFLHIVFLNA